GGILHQMSIQRECTLVKRTTTIQDYQETRANPPFSTGALPRALSYRALMQKANETLSKPVVQAFAGTSIPEQNQPDLLTPDFNVMFYGPPDGGFGVPIQVRMDASNGVVLAVDAPWDHAWAALGIPPDAMVPSSP